MNSPLIPQPREGPRDHRAPRFPVAIKGVLIVDGRVVVLRNERDEWELPGGKLEPGEDPVACLAREIAEELGIAVEIGALPMPEGYRRSIRDWARRRRTPG